MKFRPELKTAKSPLTDRLEWIQEKINHLQELPNLSFKIQFSPDLRLEKSDPFFSIRKDTDPLNVLKFVLSARKRPLEISFHEHVSLLGNLPLFTPPKTPMNKSIPRTPSKEGQNHLPFSLSSENHPLDFLERLLLILPSFPQNLLNLESPISKFRLQVEIEEEYHERDY